MAETRLTPSPWLTAPRPRPDAPLRLYCLPWAGAGAGAFHDWPDLLGPEIDVRPVALPGRERRLGERPLHAVESITEALLPALLADLDRPYAVFGHSLGALIGFETVRRLSLRGHPPTRLLVSGSRAPHQAFREPDWHRLPDAAFLDAVRGMRTTPGDPLADEELAELLLPALRADFTAAATYARPARRELGCPLTAIGGADDPAAGPADLAAWAAHTRGPFTRHQLPGDHLFPVTAAPRLADLLGPILRAGAA